METANLIRQARWEYSRRSLLNFTQTTKSDFILTWFHRTYYFILNKFAHGEIKRLIISVPPQHGKSEGSSRRLPAFLLGKYPNKRIAIVSYNCNFAKKFCRAVQRIIETEEYSEIFPRTKIGDPEGLQVKTAMEFEVVGYEGSLMAVGRGGGITGNPVDVFIYDDLYKDYAEANSPIIRDAVWDFYINVARTRLHNESQEMFVITRWHEDDIISRIAKAEKVRHITSLSELGGIGQDEWVHLNFEALKETPSSDIDPRKFGEALFPEKHGEKKLLESRRLDPIRFDCLYQGNPLSREGLLYGDDWQTYEELPQTFGNGNYTDTADAGEDYFCSVSYRLGKDKAKIYITDVVFTRAAMEETEVTYPMMLSRSDTRYSYIESNAGGRYFALKAQAKAKNVKIIWFYQKLNKESRILTNSVTVKDRIVMPFDWQSRWTEFYKHVITYKSKFAANKHHDAADVLTGIIEKEIFHPKVGIKRIS